MNVLNDQHKAIIAEIDALDSKSLTPKTFIEATMKILASRFDHFYWTGVYILMGDTLHVGPYVGPHTDHTRIPIGRGVCGSAVADNTNKIVDDVRAESNYLACNLQTRSEIVVLIRDPRDNSILGQIDIDSTKLAAFSPADEAFLEQVAQRLAPKLNRSREQLVF